MPALKDALAIIDSWMAYHTFFDRMPSVAIGIVHKDKIIFTGNYGYADLDKRRKPTKHTQYRIASLSKFFTATAILQLVEKKRLGLDDDVRQYLNWVKEEVTIRELLSHTSGLTRETKEDYWNEFNFPSEDSLRRYAAKSRAAFDPSTEFKYSNYAYGLLGAVIDSVTEGYTEYMQENVFVGLKDTTTDMPNSKDVAVGYTKDYPGMKRKAHPQIPANALKAATGFSSSVNDLCKFLLSHMNGKILKEKSKKEMRKVQWVKDSNTFWGLGCHIWKTPNGRLYGHGGSYPGFSSCMAYEPKSGLGVVVLNNDDNGLAISYLHSIFNMLFHVIKNYKSYKPEKTKVDKYVGRYMTKRHFFMDVVKVNNHLLAFDPALMQPFTNVTDLKKFKGNVFKIAKDNGFSFPGEVYTFTKGGLSIGPLKCKKVKSNFITIY